MAAQPEVYFQFSASHQEALARAAAECGIDHEYWDIFHHRHEISQSGLERLLEALGWDVASRQAVDQQRLQRLTSALSFPLPATAVLSAAAPKLRLTLRSNLPALLGYEILLEDGQTLVGSLDTSQLAPAGETAIFENGGERRWFHFLLPLPADLPLGYHTLLLAINGQNASTTHLVLCPDRAYLPDDLAQGGKIAGFNVSLYGLRSSRNWGCGDFTDLHALIDWARRDLGFSFIGLNPLHALHNRAPYNTSPYLPLSVFYKNLIYLDIERIPEFATTRCAQELFRTSKTQSLLHSLRVAERVDYSQVDRLKKRFLKLLYRAFRRAAARSSPRYQEFVSYCRHEGDLLHKFALYCSLDEVLHKQDRARWTWRDWPADYQSPDSAASQEFAARYARTIEFYKYVQFCLDEQLAAAQAYAREAGMSIGLYHDLAVATDSCGSDLWAHRAFYVAGCRVGAPPDDFSPEGQDWGFPPPKALACQSDGYHLFRESVRKIVARGGALRLDHVMRLFRLFWIPAGMQAAEGTYVRDFSTDLLHILALESVRSRNIIIGEDLGTVTDEIRDSLAAFGILSYRLFFFERYPDGGGFLGSQQYPRQALVSSSTHDLPTLAGFWQGRDIEARRAAGLADESSYQAQLAARGREKQLMLDTLHHEQLLPPDSERNAAHIGELTGDLHNAVIGFLAQVPSMVLLLNEEDLTKETEQQNLPGSTAQYPNWQRKMQLSIEDLRSPACAPYAAMFRHQLQRTGRFS
jgi:4-alpha-glucanotransferase